MKSLWSVGPFLSGILLTLLSTLNLHAWSGRGHRIVAHLAQERLSENAKIGIKEILGEDYSLSKESMWADKVKKTPAFARFASWHFTEIAPILDQDLFSARLLAETADDDHAEPDSEPDEPGPIAPTSTVEQDMEVVRSLSGLLPYALASHDPAGDGIRGIAFCKWILKSPRSTKAQKVFALRFLVHLLGDLMQPLHVGNGLDAGGTACLVKWRGDEKVYRSGNQVDLSLHIVWDDLLVNEKKCPRGQNSSVMIACSHVQWAKKLNERFGPDSTQTQSWARGEVLDWAMESAEIRDRIYPVMNNGEGRLLEVVYKDEDGHVLADRRGIPGRPYCRPKTPRGARAAVIESSYKPDLNESYYREWEPTLEQVLYKGGLRLARVLNEIFEDAGQ